MPLFVDATNILPSGVGITVVAIIFFVIALYSLKIDTFECFDVLYTDSF